jgi:hypothetical protein
VTLTTPSTAGAYPVSAQFQGDSNFQVSSASLTLNVAPPSSSISATVNLRYARTVTVTVTLKQGSATIRTQSFAYSGGTTAHTFIFEGLKAGAYTLTVKYSYYGTQTKTLTVPPDARLTFTL